DPFYLTWKAREYEVNTRFIELAGEINTYMPYYVVENAARFLNEEKKALNGAKVLILGAAYKKDIDDMRESPSLRLIELFERKGAHVDFNDPYVPKLYKMRKYNYTMKSVPVTAVNLKKYDIIVLSTDHSDYDYKFIAENSNLILDTRNAFEKHGVTAKNIKKS
ncbi:MAG: nucleotide sugar dehydrogenase, partial [Ignavibacteriae bacterium]|nr:nucleotide sugar dehydrogenase [Ignavibacteriota bacterium]